MDKLLVYKSLLIKQQMPIEYAIGKWKAQKNISVVKLTYSLINLLSITDLFVAGKLIGTGDDVTGDSKTAFELKDLSVDLVGLNDGILDTIEDGVDVHVLQDACNLSNQKLSLFGT